MRDVRTAAMDAWMDLWGKPHGAAATGPAQTGTAAAPAAATQAHPADSSATAQTTHQPSLAERAWAGVRESQAAQTAATEQHAQTAGSWAGRAMHAVNDLAARAHDALPDPIRHGVDAAESARETVDEGIGAAWNWAGDHIDLAAKAADGVARRVGTAVDGAADQVIAKGTDALRSHVGERAADAFKSGADALHGQVRAGVQFEYGETEGVLAEGASMVSGVDHLAGEAYRLTVDPAAREQAASAVAREAVRANEDPTGVTADAAGKIYHAGAGWVEGAKDASAHGGLPEYLGKGAGHVVGLVASVVAPEALVGKVGEAANVASRVGETTSVASKTEEVVSATARAGNGTAATERTADVAGEAAKPPLADTTGEAARGSQPMPSAETGTPTLAGGGTTRAYRVEGSGNQRIEIGENGEVGIPQVLRKGGDERNLFVNFGDRERARQFLQQRLQQFPDSAVKSFDVHSSFVDELRAEAVPEAERASSPGRPVIADPTKAADQFGLPGSWIERLRDAAIQGSGKAGPEE